VKQPDDILEGSTGESSSAAPAYAVPRRFERVRVKLHIRVHHTCHNNPIVTDGQAQDVSEGGIGAYIPAEFHVNENVRIEVVLPFGKRPIVFDAEVRDANGFRYGFEFLKVKEADRDELRASLAAFAITQ
jgi:hypothetical protein